MKVLLLAGTSDARRIAEGLEEYHDIELLASLAGVTRRPEKLPCETCVGGFGGAEGFGRFLKANQIEAVVDATHPFAIRMSRTAAAVCDELSLPHVQMLRPEWEPQEGDRWTLVSSEGDVAQHIKTPSAVFLATGRQTLSAFENLRDHTLICRQIDPPETEFPFPNGSFLVGRPPFSVKEEFVLFQRLGIDWLVVKNSGAMASRTKLDAARELGMPVAMIRRPVQPDCKKVDNVVDAISWVSEQVTKQ